MPVGGPSLATSSGTVVAADGGQETVHRFMLCGLLLLLEIEQVNSTLYCDCNCSVIVVALVVAE